MATGHLEGGDPVRGKQDAVGGRQEPPDGEAEDLVVFGHENRAADRSFGLEDGGRRRGGSSAETVLHRLRRSGQELRRGPTLVPPASRQRFGCASRFARVGRLPREMDEEDRPPLPAATPPPRARHVPP